MPPETSTAPASVDETLTYAFPFAVPADLAAASEDELRAALAAVRDHAGSFRGTAIDDEALAALTACRETAHALAAEINGRADRLASASDVFAELDDLEVADPAPAADPDGDDPDDDDVDPVVDPAPVEPQPTDPTTPPAGDAVTAAGGRRPAAAPRVRQVARGTRAPAGVATDLDQSRTTMSLTTDVKGFTNGQQLTHFADAARALEARMSQYPAMSAQRAGAGGWDPNMRPVTVYDETQPGRVFELRNYTRHNVLEFRTEVPANLRVEDGGNAWEVASFAANERRLPGGNLRASMMAEVKRGRSLTAAAGWCAPSETLYDLLELETLDGILSAPEIQATRGGFNIPIKGGPDFGSVYNALGNSGNTHLTEGQVISDTPKVSTEIPCPDFEEIRLGVDYYSLTGGLLQRRGYPEMVARFARAAVVALAHKINQGFIAAIAAASQNAGVVPQDPSGDDAGSALLSAVEIAILDAKYRHRMAFMSGTMEVVLPFWVIAPVRAAMSRRTGVAMMDVTNAQILSWFAERDAVVRFVYDWQDYFAGGVATANAPGGPAPIRQLPYQVQMLVYPSGTWVKATQDVAQLDTIYDSTLLSTNQFVAVFSETGWAPMQMGPISRRYTVNVDPSGVTGLAGGSIS